MRNAWIGLALASAALMGCGTPVAMTSDAGRDSGGAPDAAMALEDSDTTPPVDTGVVRDVGRGDANIEPYDGGPPAMCTGLAPVSLSGFCGAYADAFIAWYDRCHLIGPRGTAVLRAELLDGCDTSDLEAAILAGRSTYDGTAAACCFAHVTADTSCYGSLGGRRRRVQHLRRRDGRAGHRLRRGLGLRRERLLPRDRRLPRHVHRLRSRRRALRAG